MQPLPAFPGCMIGFASLSTQQVKQKQPCTTVTQHVAD